MRRILIFLEFINNSTILHGSYEPKDKSYWVQDLNTGIYRQSDEFGKPINDGKTAKYDPATNMQDLYLEAVIEQ